MKRICAMAMAITLTLIQGCSGGGTPNPTSSPPPQAAQSAEKPALQQPKAGNGTTTPPAKEDGKAYANERFRNVTVLKIAEHRYKVTGQARVFEATFGYVVEDGHNELVKGSAHASAGAPEWGAFSFSFTVKKAEPGTSLTLILFESSPKDGSRQFELVIPLPE